MSFAVSVIDAVTVTPDTPQPPAGTTVVLTADLGSRTVAITDPNTTGNPVVFQLDTGFIEDLASIFTIAIATTNSQITIDGSGLPKDLSSTGQIQITIGKNEDGNFLEVGGLVIRGSSANGLSISLDGALATTTVKPESIPESFKKIFQFGLSKASLLSNALAPSALGGSSPTLNTITELSRGKDSFLGSQYNDGILLSKGGDAVVGGGGDDVFLAASSLAGSKTKLTMDGSGGNAGSGGNDQLAVTKDALKNGNAKIRISDFDKKDDTIVLQAKRKSVKGIGTDTLKISTKNDKIFKIESDGSKFTRGSIDFI